MGWWGGGICGFAVARGSRVVQFRWRVVFRVKNRLSGGRHGTPRCTPRAGLRIRRPASRHVRAPAPPFPRRPRPGLRLASPPSSRRVACAGAAVSATRRCRRAPGPRRSAGTAGKATRGSSSSRGQSHAPPGQAGRQDAQAGRLELQAWAVPKQPGYGRPTSRQSSRSSAAARTATRLWTLGRGSSRSWRTANHRRGDDGSDGGLPHEFTSVRAFRQRRRASPPSMHPVRFHVRSRGGVLASENVVCVDTTHRCVKETHTHTVVKNVRSWTVARPTRNGGSPPGRCARGSTQCSGCRGRRRIIRLPGIESIERAAH